MSVNTLLLDFSIDPIRITGDSECKKIAKMVVDGGKKYFNNPILLFEQRSEDGGYLSLYKDEKVLINIRLFQQGVLSLNIEYYCGKMEEPIFTFDV